MNADKRFRLATSTNALALGALVLALAVVGAPLAVRAHESLSSGLPSFAVALAFVTVGVVVAWHQPRNPIGWLLLGGGGFLILSGDASTLSILDYRVRTGALPGGRLAVLLQPTWAPAIVLMGWAVLLFPDGRLASQRWRWLLWPLLAIGGLWLVGAFGIAGSEILNHHIEVTSGGDLYRIDHPTGNWAWWGYVEGAFFSLLGVVWLLWLGHQLVTFRRVTGERRLQLKWLMTGVSIFVVMGIATVANTATSGLGQVIGDATTSGLLALPITIGFGILKYRLYDIDRIVSRTISYAIVTASLIGIFVGIVALATHVLPFSSPVAVAASTLAAAALFNPLRLRVQRLVDRRFNRARYDADAIVAAFTTRLRDAVDLDTVRRELLLAIDGAVKPAHASLWIRPPVPRSRG